MYQRRPETLDWELLGLVAEAHFEGDYDDLFTSLQWLEAQVQAGRYRRVGNNCIVMSYNTTVMRAFDAKQPRFRGVLVDDVGTEVSWQAVAVGSYLRDARIRDNCGVVGSQVIDSLVTTSFIEYSQVAQATLSDILADHSRFLHCTADGKVVRRSVVTHSRHPAPGECVIEDAVWQYDQLVDMDVPLLSAEPAYAPLPDSLEVPSGSVAAMN